MQTIDAVDRTTEQLQPRNSMHPLGRLALLAGVHAFLQPAARRPLRHLRATDGPIVLIGEDNYGEELRALGQSAATALNGASVAVNKDELKNVLKTAQVNDVVHCTDNALSRKDWKLLEQETLPIWVRCVNEFGNDVVKEIFRDDKRRKRCLYEVAACAPYSKPMTTEQSVAWGGDSESIKRIVAFHRREPCTEEAVALEAGLDTFFVSLTFDEYEDGETQKVLQELANDARVTALEFRCDLLESYNPGNVLRQLHACRKASQRSWRAGEAKLMFTVRSVSQAGAFRDQDVEEMMQLLELGLRAGVDWLDVETETLSRKQLKRLRSMAHERGATLILGSHHQLGETTSAAQAERLLKTCASRSRGDAVKLVVDAASSEDAAVSATVADIEARPPRVVLALGDAGKLSRVLGRRFLPARHESLKVTAAPGQISPNEALQLRRDWGVVPAKKYAVLLESDFGSRSPAMHNAAFDACGLPHNYGVMELPDENGLDDVNSDTAQTFRDYLAAPDFGGLSVTIPHKLRVQPFLDELTDAAKRIGAVNTITPRPALVTSKTTLGGASILTGDNTDWIGISECIASALRRRTGERTGRALVVGSGGTARAACYALTAGRAARGEKPFELLVYARDVSKAEALAKAFGGAAVADLKTVTVDAVVSTIPGAANFELPAPCLANTPAVLDAAYKPASTALLVQAKAAGCPVAQGASMLVAQGVAQFQQWTGRVAPVPAMRAAVFEGVEELEGEV